MSEAVASSAVRIEASVAAALGVAAVAIGSAAGACRVGAGVGAICAVATLVLSRRDEMRAAAIASRSADVGASRNAEVGASRSADVRAESGSVAARAILGAIAAVSLAWGALQPPADLPFGRVAGYRALSGFALFFLSAYLCSHLRASFRKARFAVLLACFAALALARSVPLLDVLAAIASAVLLRELGGATGELSGIVLLFPPQLVPPWLPFVLAAIVVARRLAVLAPAAAALACAAAFSGVPWSCNPPAALLGLVCAAAAVSSRAPT
jgi:hypothetical protein